MNSETTQSTDPAAALSVSALRERLAGRVILPTDAEYDAARVVMPGIVDGHPGLIVRVANAADIARAIQFARENELEVAVRSGGHSIHGTTDGGLVIDVRDMKALDIDAAAGSAPCSCAHLVAP